MLIEDDSTVADQVIDLLESIGHGSIHVATKEEALEKIVTAEVCYVLLGLERPAERPTIGARLEAGQDLLKQIRGGFNVRTSDGRYHFLPIVILIPSGQSEHDTVMKGAFNGANAFVRKPLQNAELIANIYACLDRAGRAAHEHCARATEKAKGTPAPASPNLLDSSESEAPRIYLRPTFVRDGSSIRIEFGTQRAVFALLGGLFDLGVLLLREGDDIAANELFARRARGGLNSAAAQPDVAAVSGTTLGHAGRDSDPVFDEEALERIRETIARRRAEGTVEAIDEADELEKRYLNPALDIHRRSRGLGSPSKRARVAVHQRIKKALKLIRRDLPALYEHLGGDRIFAHRKSSPVALHVGSFCSYKPREPMNWDVRF